MSEMLVGAIAIASLVAGLFFMRYWKSTGERLFLYFAISFFIEGFNGMLLDPSSGTNADGEGCLFYLLRLVAYGLILFAIWETKWSSRKNR